MILKVFPNLNDSESKKLLEKRKKKRKYGLRAEKALCILGAGKARGSSEESVKRSKYKKVPLGSWLWRRLHRNKTKLFLKTNKQTN